MSAAFRVSRAARNDIKNIGRYTQKTYGVDQRRKYLEGLEIKFSFLAKNPDLHPERPTFDPPVRISHYEQHMVVYTTAGDGILIIRVLRSRMDIPTQLSTETSQ